MEQLQFRSAIGGFNREDVVHYLEYINKRHKSEIARLNSDLTAAQAAARGDASEQKALKARLADAEAEAAALRDRVETERGRADGMEQQLRELELNSRIAAEPVADSAAEEALRRQLDQANAELASLRTRNEALTRQELELAQCREKLARLTAENEELRSRAAVLEARLSDTQTAEAQKKSTSLSSELETYRRAERVERISRERAREISAQLKSAIARASFGPASEAGGLVGIVDRVAVELEALCGAAEKLQDAFREASDAADKLEKELQE